MNNSKLITVLSNLSKGEWQSLKKHVLANTSKESDVFSIFTFLYSHKDKISTIEEVEPIVKKHFKHLTVKVFLNHMSTLFQWLETWLVMQEIAHEKYTFDLTLLKALNRRGHYNLANQVHQKLEKKINDNEAWDTEKSKAKAIMLHYQHYSNNPIKYEKGAILYKELIDNYTLYIKEQLLLYKAELHNWGRIQKYDFSEEIMNIDKLSGIFKDSELCMTLHALNDLYEKEDVNALLKLCESLFEGKFEKHSENQTIINFYLIQRILYFRHKGVAMNDSTTIILNLYEYGLHQGIFSEYGKLNVVTFRNIINTMAAFQTYEATALFIDKWVHNVESIDTQSVKKIAYAINCFHHERYEEIPLLTRAIEYNALDEKILVLTLNVIATFINRYKDYEIYITSIENFELLLKRNKSKLSEKQYLSILNLIHFIKKYDKANYSTEIDLSEYKYLFYRSWCEKMLIKRKAAFKK